MTKPKASPQELQAKKQRQNLLTLCNRIASAYNFKTVKTWEDVYTMSGVPLENKRSGPLSYPELKQYFEELKQNLERHLSKPIVEQARIFEGKPDIGKSAARQTTDRILKDETRQPTEADIQTEEIVSSNMDNYGLPVNNNHKAFLFWFQKKAIKEILDGFLGFDVATCKTVEELKVKYSLNKSLTNVKRGMLLLAATGTGKTFMVAAVCRYLVDIGFAEDKTMGHTLFLYVTKATIVEQAKRVFQDLFLLTMKQGVEIINIEQLRSRAGEVWLKVEDQIIGGKEVTTYKWKAIISPCVIFWDESQGLKNDGSIQNLVACAYNDIKANTFQLFISATPFTRVCEAKCFCVSTRKPISDMGTGTTIHLNNNNWPTYSTNIAFPAAPDEYVEASVERMTKDMEPYIVRVRGVRSQFDAINTIRMISFQTDEERTYYAKAYQRYEEQKAKLAAAAGKAGIEHDGGSGGLQQLVEFLIFRMAAEYCRKDTLAKLMFEAVQSGKAAVCALNFKNTIIAVTQILNEKYGVPRHEISLIWGGGQTQLTKKQKMKQNITKKRDQLVEAGVDVDELLADMDLDQVEERVLQDLPEHLQLGAQSKEDRQKEIDRFQSGKSNYCMFTFRAGGVGLSLHHTDELSPVKVRHKPNGYAVLEDIDKVPVRPRKVFVAPTYSAMELVQGLGRCPRLTSLSDTEQELIFYRGTIEEEVAKVVSQKLRCLSKVVRQREKWTDIILGGVKAEEHLDKNGDVVVEEGTNYDDLTTDEEGEE